MPLVRTLRAALVLAAACVGQAPAVAQVNVQINTPSPLLGRWSESTTCASAATLFVFTPTTFEIVDNGGRGFLANVAYVQQGTDQGVRVTAPPATNRWGPRAPALGDTFLFRYNAATRMITPVAIVRANARRDQIGTDTPNFHRCR
jgi:hypothetical protein